MPPQSEATKVSVQEFALRFRPEMIPLNNRFAYFTAAPLGESDLKDLLEEPIAALPPALQELMAKVLVFLVPYLEKTNGRGAEMVTFDRPAEKAQSWAAHFVVEKDSILVLATRDRDSADYHYSFYRAVSELVADGAPATHLDRFVAILREELRAGVHGEVDEEGWKLKAQIERTTSAARRDSKTFRSYSRQAFIDTLTLYLHGICCDIDVDTGPRQLPSRFLRRRLELLRELYPPPQGYAVFPEELNG